MSWRNDTNMLNDGHVFIRLPLVECFEGAADSVPEAVSHLSRVGI